MLQHSIDHVKRNIGTARNRLTTFRLITRPSAMFELLTMSKKKYLHDWYTVKKTRRDKTTEIAIF